MRLPLRSEVCSSHHFYLEMYERWARALREEPKFCRKQWEFVYICQALAERGMLEPGRRGVGFGVGAEPIVALFAALGCEVLATDLSPDVAAGIGWKASRDFNAAGVCGPGAFAERVRMRDVDMNDIPPDLVGFDFCWSACALEHLGTLEHGLRFIERAMRTLRPGGIAVHTTEFNLTSAEETIDDAGTVLYRRRDFEELRKRLHRHGHRLEPLFVHRGCTPKDQFVAPHPDHEAPFLRVQAMNGFVTTSVGLVIERGPTA